MHVAFPSLAFFQTLQTLMRQDEARFRRLGFIDTTFGVHLVGPQGQEWRYQVAFEVFDCHAVTEVAAFDLTTLDFVLTGELAAWVEMLQNIRQHGGADVAHSLNTLTHFGERLQMLYADPDNRDKFFRFQESLQEFFDLASAAGCRTTSSNWDSTGPHPNPLPLTREREKTGRAPHTRVCLLVLTRLLVYHPEHVVWLQRAVSPPQEDPQVAGETARCGETGAASCAGARRH